VMKAALMAELTVAWKAGNWAEKLAAKKAA
jgi:hypothetical protein